MGEARIGESPAVNSSCPRLCRIGAGGAVTDFCPAVEVVEGEAGTDEYLAECVSALLGCRGFLWDVLLDGEWTGCAAGKLKELATVYGWERVCDAFEEE